MGNSNLNDAQSIENTEPRQQSLFKFGTKGTIIPVATRLQANLQADKVVGITLFGMYETTNCQNLPKEDFQNVIAYRKSTSTYAYR